MKSGREQKNMKIEKMNLSISKEYFDDNHCYAKGDGSDSYHKIIGTDEENNSFIFAFIFRYGDDYQVDNVEYWTEDFPSPEVALEFFQKHIIVCKICPKIIFDDNGNRI